MAISQIMSNPNDLWSMEMYQTNFSNIPSTQEAPPPTNNTAGAATSAAVSSRNSSLSPDQGRVSKPLRRRSRASRRTPTTVLNTDAANFRAMVQQFTGGPSARPQHPVGGASASAFNFSFTDNSNASMAAPATSGFQVLYQNNQLMQQQQMLMMNSLHGGAGGIGRGAPSSQAAPESSPASGHRSYDDFML